MMLQENSRHGEAIVKGAYQSPMLHPLGNVSILTAAGSGTILENNGGGGKCAANGNKTCVIV